MTLKLINPRYYLWLIKRFLLFLIHPSAKQDKSLTRIDKIRDVIILFLLKFVTSSILAIVIKSFFNYDNTAFAEAKTLYSPVLLLIIGVVILPTIEEIAFRLMMLFKAENLSLSFAVLVYYIFTKGYFQTYVTDIDNFFFIRVTIAIIAGFAMYFIVLRHEPKVRKFWELNFKWIYYFSFVLFAWIHIINYDLTLEILLLMPVLTLPQLIGGIVYGFVRVKYGFVYSCILHGLNNFVPIGLTLVLF